MQALKRFLALGLSCIAACAFAACGGGGARTSWDSVDVGSDGGAYTDEEDENVTEITIFKNDWASFNTARQSNSPIYQRSAATSWR